jgi:uncharacterized membrane protein YphA (DoxX/SURF4 family)
MTHFARLITRIALPIARLAFGALFLWASVGKITHPDHFVSEVEKYQLMSASASGAVGLVLPWLEFIVGVGLITGFWQAGTWLAVTVLFALFTFVRASALRRGLDIACGCGIGEAEITPRSLVYSAVLLIAAITAYSLTIWTSKVQTTVSSSGNVEPRREMSSRVKAGVS